jgi:hypothetical protein
MNKELFFGSKCRRYPERQLFVHKLRGKCRRYPERKFFVHKLRGKFRRSERQFFVQDIF